MNTAAYTAARHWFPFPAPPRSAGYVARATPHVAVFDWTDGRNGLPGVKAHERDGFDVTVSVDYDQHYNPFEDSDCYGSWGSKEYAPNGVKAVRRDKQHRDARSFEYWIPGDGQDYASLFREARKTGYARGPAADYARERARYFYLQAEDTARDGAGYVVRVTVRKVGIELGSATCGGVDGLDLDHLDDLAGDCYSEALTEARGALDTLCGCRGAK